MTYLDIIVTVGVLSMSLFAIWRVGQLNPVGTGQLARRLNALELKVGEQGQRMDGIDRAILSIADRVGTMGDAVDRIDTQMAALRVEVAGDRGLTERTWAAVSRLEGFFIQDSFAQRARP